jgi:ribosomal protein L11 methyltransferase
LISKNNDLIIKSCIDLGCGSEILGISAVKFGLVPATLIDTDADAIRISQENALANELFLDQMDFVVEDVKTRLHGRQTNFWMANILSDVLVENANSLVNSVTPENLLNANRILRDEKLKIALVFSQFTNKKQEYVLESLIDDGEWSALEYFRGYISLQLAGK